MPMNIGFAYVVPGRLELPTSTLSVWRSNQLSYSTGQTDVSSTGSRGVADANLQSAFDFFPLLTRNEVPGRREPPLQKGGVPAAPSGTATLLRLSPTHRFHPRPTLAVTDFRRPRLSWLDGRCVQGPGTYSPRHG